MIFGSKGGAAIQSIRNKYTRKNTQLQSKTHAYNQLVTRQNKVYLDLGRIESYRPVNNAVPQARMIKSARLEKMGRICKNAVSTAMKKQGYQFQQPCLSKIKMKSKSITSQKQNYLPQVVDKLQKTPTKITGCFNPSGQKSPQYRSQRISPLIPRNLDQRTSKQPHNYESLKCIESIEQIQQKIKRIFLEN